MHLQMHKSPLFKSVWRNFFECALFKYTQVAFYVIYSKLSASTSAHSVQLSTVLFHKGLLADDRSLQPHKLPKPW